MLTSSCLAENIASVADAIQRVRSGFHGEAQIKAYYFFHPEEDVLCDTAEPLEGAYIQLVFLPLLNDVPRAKRYDARLAIAKKLNGKRVVITGILKKGTYDERLTGEYPFIEVEKIEEANQALVPTATSVTPAADAPVAPAAAAAHL